ncbi:heme o synthase [Granulicella cerasi]|uniref:Protoheme IX farnesyltransferase n=1 Tax=Granulicella cerasi TaxID=741063 RepID=A0ABW1ZC45_9BACT|nr:heme o synthase [Granulicella cerasi]
MSTATTSSTETNAAERSHSLLGDYSVLFKPRVSAMVLLTAAGGFYLGCLRTGISPFSMLLLHTMLGVAIVTCGSGALNQALERATDRMMPRTAARPMAQHRIGLAHGLILGFLLTFGGAAYLALYTNLLSGTLTLLTAVAYVTIYTPLKRITSLNTFIGAFPGALPPLIGWTAARGVIEWPGIALFAILFVWQFPHFMAIGWLYRADYKLAGIRVAATQDPIEDAARGTVAQALFYAVLMIPVALWPTFLHITGWPYAIAAFALSIYYLVATIRFASITKNPNDPENRKVARQLLRVSVIYLPLLLMAMALNAQGHLLLR